MLMYFFESHPVYDQNQGTGAFADFTDISIKSKIYEIIFIKSYSLRVFKYYFEGAPISPKELILILFEFSMKDYSIFNNSCIVFV